MNEEDIRIAPLGDVNGLARAHGHDLDIDAGVLLEGRQNDGEEA